MQSSMQDSRSLSSSFIIFDVDLKTHFFLYQAHLGSKRSASTANMSLPTVQTLVDCADFSKTVQPYIPQLYALPTQILQNLTSVQGLKDLYLSTNPLIAAFSLSLFLAPVFLIAAEVNRNYSQVDRFWSLLPTIYNAHYVIWAHANGLPTERMDSMLAFSTIWSVCSGSGVAGMNTNVHAGSFDIQLLEERRL